MKRIICIIVCALCLTTAFGASALTEMKITVEINGELQKYDVTPKIIKNRTMVPMRGIFEAFGADVNWDEALKIVMAEKDGIKVELVIGSLSAKINDNDVALDSEPVISDGRTLVPVRFVSEALGAKVEWDEKNRRVIIEKSAKDGEKRDEIQSYKIINVIASSNDGNIPSNAIDGDYDTRWSAEGKKQWIKFEIDDVAEIGYAGIAFYCGNERAALFSLEVSEDGVNWDEVYNGKSLMQLNMAAYDMKGKKAKYVRFIGNGTSVNMWNSICEFRLYPPRGDGSMPVEEKEFDGNVTVAEEKQISPELEKILDNFKNLLDEDAYKWAASMYDPVTGGFYFSESSKVNNEFYVTLESTNFVIDFLRFNGVLDKNTAVGSMPNEIRTKMLKFVLQRQDPDDGYYYDIVYGKNVSELKRGRDLIAGLKLTQYLGGEPLYKTPAERILDESQDDEEEISEEGSSGLNTESLPEYLQSLDAYKEFLDELDFDYDPYLSCSNIGANKAMILALGYGDYTLDFLVSKQNPETGLWGAELTNNSLNGALKVCNWFTKTTMEYPYIDKMIDSVLYISENEESDVANCNIWNRVALVNVGMASYKEMDAETAKKVEDNLIPFLTKTYEQALSYRHSDGGYSVMPGYSVANYQGVLISLGGQEGDGNGLAITCDIVRDVFALCGQKLEMNGNVEYGQKFWEWVLQGGNY